MLDIGSHIVSSLSLGMPESYRDIVDKLGGEGVVPMELVERLRELASFRDVLEHGYLALDASQVREYLERGGDMEEFARCVVDFLDDRGT